jgi:hypothetical protein
LFDWLIRNWALLAAGIVLAAYFAFYVLAMREQRASADDRRPRLPCDRC